MALIREEAGSNTRAERLELAIEELRKRFGQWIVYRLREARPSLGEKIISTGSIGLDRATGIGGVPRGRISEFYGPPTSGKSSIVAHTLANAQRGGGFAALLDTDGTVDLERLRICGVNLDDLLLAVPQSTREAMDIACLLAASNCLDALVVSSTNGLVHGPRGDRRAFNAGLRRLVVELGEAPTATGFITHLDRSWRFAGNSARALAYAATLRVLCTPLELIIHDSGEALGLRLRTEVIKNKLASPYGTAEMEILGDRGIHTGAEAFDLGLEAGMVVSGPLGFAFGDAWLGRGRESAIRSLDNDAELLEALRAELTERG